MASRKLSLAELRYLAALRMREFYFDVASDIDSLIAAYGVNRTQTNVNRASVSDS